MVVLCTSVGNDGFPDVLNGLRCRSGVIVIGCDVDPSTPAFMLTDHSVVVPPRSKRDKLFNSLTDIIAKYGVKLVIPMSTEDQTFFANNSENPIFKNTNLAVSSKDSVLKTNNKHLFYEFCAERGYPVPNFTLTKNRDEFLKLVLEYRHRKKFCVLKLAFGTGSQGVKIIDPSLDAVDRFFSRDNIRISTDEVVSWIDNVEFFPQIMVCDYLPGVHISVDAFRGKQGDFFSVARTETRHLYGMGTAGLSLDAPELNQIVSKLSSELDLSYCFNVEFKADEFGKMHLLEINPRFPASIGHSLAVGINFPLMVVDEALGNAKEVSYIKKNIQYGRVWRSLSATINSI